MIYRISTNQRNAHNEFIFSIVSFLHSFRRCRPSPKQHLLSRKQVNIVIGMKMTRRMSHVFRARFGFHWLLSDTVLGIRTKLPIILKQVPRRYIRCDCFIVTSCTINYDGIWCFFVLKNGHIRCSKITQDGPTNGRADTTSYRDA